MNNFNMLNNEDAEGQGWGALASFLLYMF